MTDVDIIKIDSDTETICCDGGQDGLGHPAVYYTFDNKEKIICSYCGRTYIKEEKN
tara:strand:- start:594 stop:761 length:168 start_codon:yes stop_codon:yes gene_type:complete